MDGDTSVQRRNLPYLATKPLPTFSTIVAAVLQYTPQSMSAPGWHEIKVRVTRSGSFAIRAHRAPRPRVVADIENQTGWLGLPKQVHNRALRNHDGMLVMEPQRNRPADKLRYRLFKQDADAKFVVKKRLPVPGRDGKVFANPLENCTVTKSATLFKVRHG
jgi:hypothetical protein